MILEIHFTMAIYRFRITFEEFDDVSRDIEIRPTQTFDDLHVAIQEAIGFDASQPASFFMSDVNWKKGKEISSRPLSEDESTRITTLSKSRLCDSISDPHQKILYEFDPANTWSLYVELIKILPKEELVASYPRCVREINEAPKQYGNNTPGVLPVPDEFDEADLEDDIVDDIEEEVLGTDVEDIPEGEERIVDFIDVAGANGVDVDSELETADEDMLDDDPASETDEF